MHVSRQDTRTRRVTRYVASRRVASRHGRVTSRRLGRSRQRRRWRACDNDDDKDINRRDSLPRRARLTKAHSGYTLHK